MTPWRSAGLGMAGGLFLWLALPSFALADNCSSPGDCFQSILPAAAAAGGAGALAAGAGAFWGGRSGAGRGGSGGQPGSDRGGTGGGGPGRSGGSPQPPPSRWQWRGPYDRHVRDYWIYKGRTEPLPRAPQIDVEDKGDTTQAIRG